MGYHSKYIAHIRKSDGAEQTVMEHLEETAKYTQDISSKISLGSLGYLLGLCHDLCKHTRLFQDYLQNNNEEIDTDTGASSDDLRGNIDHSTGGAQYVYYKLFDKDPLLAQLLAFAIASHHGGMMDCVSTEGENLFYKRMQKADDATRLHEALSSCDPALLEKLNKYLDNPKIIKESKTAFCSLKEPTDSRETMYFKCGLLARMLLSFLIDADRRSTADFMQPEEASIRQAKTDVSWDDLIEPLEKMLSSFEGSEINRIRNDIAEKCFNSAQMPRGIFKLCVPTGGGKTLASLRFALHHAKMHGMERIFYIVPYTSIIEQNADVVRKMYTKFTNSDSIVLEHHSNLSQKERTLKQRLLSENWDAPIVFTTMVQFLNALFDSGTKAPRRMHALCNSVIVFDEIQSLPIKCVEMFNVATRFLTKACGVTAVLCTATQPLLDKIQNVHRAMPKDAFPIICDEVKLHQTLRRTNLNSQIRDGGWESEDVARLLSDELKTVKSVLVVVNTKVQARVLYKACESLPAEVFHLSTDMCPQHRLDTIKMIRYNLEPSKRIPTVCISTALIEAGVDLDFDTVIRYLAGLNSVVQAAGRCNRNGRRPCGIVYLVNAARESLRGLDEIQIGQECTLRVLNDFDRDPARLDNDLMGPKAMEQFYQYYFFSRKSEMCFPVSSNSSLGYEGDLFSTLSANDKAVKSGRYTTQSPAPLLPQSFKSANKSFYVIDQYTQSVIVPYKNGKDIIISLCALRDFASAGNFLMQAQRYIINMYRDTLRVLTQEKAVHEVQAGSGIFYLDARWYDEEFGLSEQGKSMDVLMN